MTCVLLAYENKQLLGCVWHTSSWCWCVWGAGRESCKENYIHSSVHVERHFFKVRCCWTSTGGLDAWLAAVCLYKTLGAIELVGFKVTAWCQLEFVTCEKALWKTSWWFWVPRWWGMLQRSMLFQKSIFWWLISIIISKWLDSYIYRIFCLKSGLLMQLKNMISALNSFRAGGTKAFSYQVISFGWETINRMWQI